MAPEQVIQYALPVVILAFLGWRSYKFKRVVKKEVPVFLAEGAHIIDVRTEREFAGGSAKGSINIPLSELDSRVATYSVDTPLIVCCASGARSGAAVAILQKKGFKRVINAGPWTNL